MKKYLTRYGDNYADFISGDQIKADIESGSQDAAERAHIPPLTQDEMDYLYEIIISPQKIVSVEPGNEVVVSFDAGTLKLPVRNGIPMDRLQAILTQERALASDSIELCHVDYSYKPVKAIISEERQTMEQAQLMTTLPLLYGAMPNLGLYTRPDGPVGNWSELLPAGKIAEAREAQEEAIQHAIRDIVFVASQMIESGADGINLDTVGASGDADVKASLEAVKILKQKYPQIGFETGMAGEFNMGMHGLLEIDGERIAGLYPHKQVKMAEKCGVSIFGMAVNTNSNMSLAWNLARVCTFAKETVKVSTIPVHANVGMGVGGIPLSLIPAADAVSRVDKALIEIAKVDGL
ncbi:dimethylamine methyltransferase [Candidatus Formimonas warabiya]|uniref:Dimethylamine methyltransferase n=1 Tax=Formimonas warabiya TaxID=1761012 RepID=A0A3G1L0G7_FORW1|nr:dimethylamine methyltransferase [Candidatus Formimonas warabiya]